MRPFRNVLIVHPYGIGDLLFVTPVLRALRLIPSVERVDLLLGSRTEGVVRSNPHVDEIFRVDKDAFHSQGNLKTFQEVLRLGQVLRRRHYDLLIDYSMRGEYAFFSQFFLGIPTRVGFDYKRRGFFHNYRLPIPEGFRDRHVIDYDCDLAEKIGVLVKDRFLEFYLSQTDREDATRLLEEVLPRPFRRFLAVSPGGGESWGKDADFKRWPVHFFAELISLLAKALALDGCVILGGSKEKTLGEELSAELKVPSVDFTGQIPLNVTAALLERSHLFLGNDGGLMHLAHALRTPLAAFFGPVDPAVYGPYPATDSAVTIVKNNLDCRPCYEKFRYRGDCATRACLRDLTVPEAFEFLKSSGFLKRLMAPSSAEPGTVKASR